MLFRRNTTRAIASPPLQPNGPIIAYTVQYRRVDQVLATCEDMEVKVSFTCQAIGYPSLTLATVALQHHRAHHSPTRAAPGG
jgi:hypothetical protein